MPIAIFILLMCFCTIKFVCEWHSIANKKNTFSLVMSQAVAVEFIRSFLFNFDRNLAAEWEFNMSVLTVIACVLTLTEWAITNKLQQLKRLSHQLDIINSTVFVTQQLISSILQTHSVTISFSTYSSPISNKILTTRPEKSGLVYSRVYTQTSDEPIFIILLNRIIGLTAFRLEKEF